MKTSDYISVFTLAIAGTILAYFLMNYFLGDPLEKTVSFEYLEEVSGDLAVPDGEIFNVGAINPTVEVFVGSCEDINHDGVIDDGELVECGESKRVDTGETTNDMDMEVNSDDMSSSSELEVQEGVTEENNVSEPVISGDEAARQETVSE